MFKFLITTTEIDLGATKFLKFLRMNKIAKSQKLEFAMFWLEVPPDN